MKNLIDINTQNLIVVLVGVLVIYAGMLFIMLKKNTHAIERNADLAVKMCGVGNVKSVTQSNYVCVKN